MARRTFDVIDVTEILVHWHAGRSISEVSASLGVDRKTIRKYVAPAIAAGMAPGGPALVAGGVGGAGAGLVPGAGRHEAAAGDLAGDRGAPRLHRRAAQGRGDRRRRSISGCATSMAWRRRWRRSSGRWRRTCPRRSAATRWWCCATTPAAGRGGADRLRAAGHVDRPGHRQAATTVWAFVMVLACSRHMFVRPVLRMDQRAWTEAHVEAFAFFGGVPRPARAGQPAHRGRPGPTCTTRRSTAPMPSWPSTTACWSTRPGRASPGTRPGSSGRCPTCGTRSGAAGSSPRWQQMQAAALAWCRDVAGQRASPAVGRAPPRCRCSPRSRPPRCNRCRRRPFVLATWSTRKVGPDIHVKVGKAIYSVPWRLIGQRVDARQTWTMVQFFHKGQLDRHPRPQADSGKQTDLSPLPAGEDRVPDAHPDLVPHAGPPRSARPAPRSSPRCWRSTPCSGCAPPRACSAWPTSTAPPGWKPPAPRRSRSATRPTAPSRASSPPAPRPTRRHAPTGDGGAAAHLHGPAAVRERHRHLRHARATP